MLKDDKTYVTIDMLPFLAEVISPIDEKQYLYNFKQNTYHYKK